MARSLGALGGESAFGLYHGDAHYIIAFDASDGVAVFYVPRGARAAGGRGQHPLLKQGFNLFSVPSASLNQLCQSATLHFLRIIEREVGSPITLSTAPPPETDIEFEGNPRLSLLSKELLDHLDDPIPITTVAASPIWRVEQGIVQEFLPTRTKLWSPLRAATTGGAYRMYAWTHAELWWRAQDFALDNEAAENLARSDALALKVILQVAPQLLSAPVVLKDTGSSAADELDRRCSSFEALLQTSGDNEEDIHQWLLLPGNHIFLDPTGIETRSKVSFGAHVSDFVIRCADDKYVLCEIEPATTRIFVKSGEPSSHFNHAIQQVLDWQRYIRDNVRTVRDELSLPGIYEPKGFVVLGRSSEISSDGSVANRWRDIKNRGRDGIEVLTYDDLIAKVRQLAQTLRTAFRGKGQA